MSDQAFPPQSTEENPAGSPIYDPQATGASTLGEAPAYESQLAGAPAYAHTTYQASARPQLHGRTKSEEAAYLESLRLWAKEKEVARPGDGTLSATPAGYAGYGGPLREGAAGTGVVMGVQEQADANANVNRDKDDWIKYIPRESEEERRKYEDEGGLKGFWHNLRGQRKGSVFGESREGSRERSSERSRERSRQRGEEQR